MKAEELRHGNLIQREGITWVVNDIFGASGLVTVLPGIDGKTLGRRSIHDFDPIPLTEENIKRFGISGSYQFAENFTLYVDGTDGISIEEYWEGAFPLEHIKYLHQLQNLYFALTGNELKLTP